MSTLLAKNPVERRIAFVHYPHGPKDARLETMPFAFNTVRTLAKAGWQVDLYVWEKPIFRKLISDYSLLLPETVRTHYFTESRFNPINPWRNLWFKARFQKQRSYYCVFGVGQIGAYIGNLMAKFSSCPFVQIVDEFPSVWPKTQWTELERLAAKDAAILVIPDGQQFEILAQELEVMPTKPYAVLPNVAVLEQVAEPINWHDRLGLPEHTIPFLYAGKVSAWAKVPELLATVPDWPEQAVLIVHSRSEQEIRLFQKEFVHLDVKDRIFWSFAPLPQDELNSLVSYCAGNFALYLKSVPFIEYIDFSSGKLMRSLVCGTPAIATNLSSFKFVEEHELGVLVNDDQSIPAAVNQIMDQRETYRKRCLDFCRIYASFENYWPKFCHQLKQETQIDLEKSKLLPSLIY